MTKSVFHPANSESASYTAFVPVRHTVCDRDALLLGWRTRHFSRSWLEMLRFTSLDKRRARQPYDDGRRAGSVGSFFPEIKRSAASHSGKK